MAIPEERCVQLEAEVSQMKVSLSVHEAGLEHQKKNLLDYIEKEFATTKLVMTEIVEGAKIEFNAQRTQLQGLYEATAHELASIKERIEKNEGPGHKDHGKLVAAKQMIPRVLENPEDWKKWKSEVEDYCEVVKEGMKAVLEATKGKKEEIEQEQVTSRW